MNPKVTVVVLNYNQLSETSKCLKSLGALSYPSFDMIVVDNGSRENPQEVLKDHFQKVHWILLRENVGFAAGCNQGIGWALSHGAEAILLLNNDTRVSADLLDKMVESAFLDPRTGVVGGVVYRAENLDRPFLAGMRFDFFRARIVRLLPKKKKETVPSVSGSCLLVKKEVFEKIGLLDERFFIYFEETDFCYRAREADFGVLYDPRVTIQHEEGLTFGRESATTRYFHTRNRLLFISKHAPLWIRPWSVLARTAQDMLLLFLFLLKGRGEMSRAVLFGLLDYGKGQFGKGRLEAFFRG